MQLVGLVVVVGPWVAQAQTTRAPLTSIEQKLDALQTAVDGSASPRYDDNGDGTITDRQTGLMWLKLDDAGGPLDKDTVRNWNDAITAWLDQVNSLTKAKASNSADGSRVSFAGGYTDWRLPTIVELQTTVVKIELAAAQAEARLVEQQLKELEAGSRPEDIAEAKGFTPQDFVAVGDGANDLPMLKLAGTGVALHAKPVVATQAEYRIDHGNLTALLYLQGYRMEEFTDA